MTEPDGIDTAIQHRMLRVAVRNSARSVPLLVVAVVFIAWLGWTLNLLVAELIIFYYIKKKQKNKMLLQK